MIVQNKKITSRGIKFPVLTYNKEGEKIEIEREQGSRGYIYLLKVNNYQLVYCTNDFADCLKYAHITKEELE